MGVGGNPMQNDGAASPTMNRGAHLAVQVVGAPGEGGGLGVAGLTSPQDDALMKRKRGARYGAIPLDFPMNVPADGHHPSNSAPSSSVAAAIIACLEAVLQPVSLLRLVDDSAAHAGHAGAAQYPGGESHFVLHCVSPAFVGLSRVKRHQLVYGALVHPELGDLMATKVHALNIKAQTPEEHAEGGA